MKDHSGIEQYSFLLVPNFFSSSSSFFFYHSKSPKFELCLCHYSPISIKYSTCGALPIKEQFELKLEGDC